MLNFNHRPCTPDGKNFLFSYVNEMVQCGIAYSITEDFFVTNKSFKIVQNIRNSKSINQVIASEITSKHRRSEKKTSLLSSNTTYSKIYRTT